jgi:hypothetical protein
MLDAVLAGFVAEGNTNAFAGDLDGYVAFACGDDLSFEVLGGGVFKIERCKVIHESPGVYASFSGLKLDDDVVGLLKDRMACLC